MRRVVLPWIAALAVVLAAGSAAAGGPSARDAPDRARPWLGVHVVDLTPELRAHLGADADRGLLVGRVVASSPAAKAGVQVGDVLVEVDGHAIDDAADVRAALVGKAPGAAFEVRVIRDGGARTLRATAATHPLAGFTLGLGPLLRIPLASMDLTFDGAGACRPGVGALPSA